MRYLLSIVLGFVFLGCSKSPAPLAEKQPSSSVPTHPAPEQGTKEAGTGGPFQELQGSWVVAQATLNNKLSHDRALLEGNWKFQGNELTLESKQKGNVQFQLQLDEEAQPKAFQLKAIEPANAGSGWMLFMRETNALKIAFYDNLQGRPTGFEPREPRAEPELVVVTLLPKK